MDKTDLKLVASNLHITAKALEEALVERVIAAKGEVMQKTHSLAEAEYGRDALAKVGFLTQLT